MLSRNRQEKGFQHDLDYYANLPYRIVIDPDPEEGGYVASFPELRGCLICCESLNRVGENAIAAKKAWIKAALESGITIPAPKAFRNKEQKEEFDRKMREIRNRVFHKIS